MLKYKHTLVLIGSICAALVVSLFFYSYKNHQCTSRRDTGQLLSEKTFPAPDEAPSSGKMILYELVEYEAVTNFWILDPSENESYLFLVTQSGSLLLRIEKSDADLIRLLAAAISTEEELSEADLPPFVSLGFGDATQESAYIALIREKEATADDCPVLIRKPGSEAEICRDKIADAVTFNLLQRKRLGGTATPSLQIRWKLLALFEKA